MDPPVRFGVCARPAKLNLDIPLAVADPSTDIGKYREVRSALYNNKEE
ncbi:MAG: hypothetical protein ACE1ZA_04655 [Pseudomonadales bacterium]